MGRLDDGAKLMWRVIWYLIKLLVVLAVLCGIAFVGYAYLGPIFMADDFTAPVQQIVIPVTLGAD